MTRAAVGTSRYSVQRYLPSSCITCYPEEEAKESTKDVVKHQSLNKEHWSKMSGRERNGGRRRSVTARHVYTARAAFLYTPKVIKLNDERSGEISISKRHAENRLITL